MPSFDVVSKLEWSEVTNAVNQAQREISQRFDFKGTGAEIEQSEASFQLTASTDDRVAAVWDVLIEKLIRRKVSLKHFEKEKPTKGPKGNAKMLIKIKEGIDSDNARAIVKLIKDSKLKVQAAIQQDVVRITGKQRDDLQGAISFLKSQELPLELQYTNFRD
jgi:cyclic-di-GMP-binding protein